VPDPATAPPARLEGVRTAPPPSLVGSRCPVCQENVLQGRQTVCSGRCRAKRWRDSRVARDPEIRAALETIARLVQVMLGRLEKGGPSCLDSGRSS
jgi:predicted nucleic acid-binding Zn ribbon protein